VLKKKAVVPAVARPRPKANASDSESMSEEFAEEGPTPTVQEVEEERPVFPYPPFCSNCGTKVSPCWRKSLAKPTVLLCNACGLLEKREKSRRKSD